MKFHEVFKNILFQPDIERPLSRIYGYARQQDGRFRIVDDEARIIASVIIYFASRETESADELIRELLEMFNEKDLRNRSGKRWTRQSLLGLIRPVYAGVCVSPRGVWRQSRLYPLIVSVERMKAAIKRVKSEKMAL